MKAIRVRAFGGPEVLQLVHAPDLTPGPGQVLVRLAAAGVNPVETYLRSGQYARLPELPFTPGTDGAGIIYQKGPGVHPTLAEGQRVWISGHSSGTYAEAAVIEATLVHPLPDRITFAQGAALGVSYTTAYRALVQRGRARPGETVLVHGATGGTGLAAVQFARMLGLRVLATGGTDTGRLLLSAQGAEVFDHHSAGLVGEVNAATGGVDLIVEMLANVNLPRDLQMLGRGGRVVVVGSRGPVEINPRELMSREADIRGVMSFNATPLELTETWAAIQAGLSSGALDPVIAEEIPLAEAPRSHESILSQPHAGKIVLNCGGI